jgi:SanA protein
MLLLAILSLLILIVLGAFPLVYATLRYQSRMYAAADVPPRRVTIVFGARVMPDGQPSAMLKDRVAAAADLYHTGKTDILLMTGDNRTVDYNEPEAMRQYALGLGVPDEAIVLDYAGRRTYDSCYRARDIFQVDEAILVTQKFHLPRALMLCNGLGVDAVGVAADYQRPEGYWIRSMIYSQSREFVATGFAMFDLLRRPKPVLGEPLPIVSAG